MNKLTLKNISKYLTLILLAGVMALTTAVTIAGTAPAEAASRKQNEQWVYKAARNHGFNKHAACGLLAAAAQESGVNPYAQDRYRNAYGLFQWAFAKKQAFFKYAGKKNRGSVSYQMNFLVKDMKRYGQYNKVRSFKNNYAGGINTLNYYAKNIGRLADPKSFVKYAKPSYNKCLKTFR